MIGKYMDFHNHIKSVKNILVSCYLIGFFDQILKK